MHEIVLNLHMHTRYSDGTGSHLDLARAAIRRGIDALLVTDHNIRVGALQRYYEQGGNRVLVLIGEEIHDRTRVPQKNHLLAFGADRELSAFAGDLDSLFRLVRQAGGISFLAHPVDPAAPAFREPDISWEIWDHHDFTGLELWNGFSEFKAHLHTRWHGLLFAFFPALMPLGPLPAAIRLWDQLLEHRPTVAIGGSDAHALRFRLGPLKRTVFPYEYHFRAVNTHVLLEAPLSGDATEDSAVILAALAAGRCFIGYDLPRSTKGFRFVAHGTGADTNMGSGLSGAGGSTLHVQAPDLCELRLLRNGLPVNVLQRGRGLTHRVLEPGVYRVEAYRRYWGRRRAWILSNPIYVH